MSERYIRVFSLPNNLYAQGAPVLIAAGALLKDTQTGNIIAQLKLRNIGIKHIVYVKVSVVTLDSVKRPLGDRVDFDYLDIHASRGQEFGQKTPIYLPNPVTRAYTVRVTEVAFEDGTVWSDTESSWEHLPDQELLSTTSQCSDPEMIKQVHIELGSDANYVPRVDGNIWRCFCGAVNSIGEQSCYNCGINPVIDFTAIAEKKDLRLVHEREEAELRKRKKRKRIKVIVSMAIAIVLAALLSIFVVIPFANYYRAKRMLKNGEYDKAIETFEALDGFKDSEKMAKYSLAMKYLSEDDFSEARDLFSSLKGFRDSEKKVKESAYREAESRFSQGKYADAERLYDLSGDYVDYIRQPEEAELHQAIKLYLDGKNEEAIALSYKLISTNDAKETEYYKKCCDVAYNLASECCQTSANRVVVKTAYLIFDCLSNENYPGGCSVWKEKCVGKILVPEGQYKSQSKEGSNHSSSSSYIKNLTFSVDAETLYILVSGEWSLDKGSIKDSKVYGINSDYDPYCLIQIGEDQYTLFFVDNCIRAYKKNGEKNVLYAVYEKYE